MARVLWWLSAAVSVVGVGLMSVSAGLIVAGVLGMLGALFLVEVKD